MPQDAPPASALPRSSNHADRADLDAINRSIDRMRASTSTDPYILTIPQDVEPRYHHSYQYQAMQWLHQAPFQLKEGEMTQYQTFIYHEHGSDMYVLHNSRLREGADGSAGKSRLAAGTGTGTPSGGPKKKITLDAYKRKNTPAGTPAQGTGAVAKGAPELKQAPDLKRAPEVKHAEEVKESQEVKRADLPTKKAAVKGPVERLKAQAEDLPEVPMQDDTVTPAIEVATETKELKRKRRNTEQEGGGLDAVAASEEPVTKKARAGPPSLVAKEPHEPIPPQPEAPVRSPTTRPETPPATSEETGLPPKLSPLEVPSLPSRLSPGIPANMVATLKAREQLRSSSSDGSAPSLSIPKKTKLSPPKRLDGISKHKSPAPRNGFKASSSSPAVRSDVEEKLRAPTSDARQRINTPALSQEDEAAVGKALKAKVKKSEKTTRPEDAEMSQDDEADLGTAAKARKQEKVSRANVVEASHKDNASAIKVSKTKQGNQLSSEQKSASELTGSHGGTNAGAQLEKMLPRREDEHAARKTVRSSKQDVPSLTVKLKYKKQQKEQIRRLLLLRPHPDDLSEPQPALAPSPAPVTKAAEESKSDKSTVRRRDPNAKGVAQKVGPASNGARKKVENKIENKAPTSEKRPPPTEPEARGPAVRAEKLADTPMTVATEASAKLTAGPVESKPTTAQPVSARKPEAAQAAGTAATDISFKRKAASDVTESPAKRKKIPDPIETKKEPSTPVQPNLLSPVALLSSAQRSQQATPSTRKDHVAVSAAMAREQSTTSNGNTPSTKLSNTPITNGTSTSQLNGNSRPLANQLSNKTPKQQVWEDEQKRLETLGRDLKHAATDHLKANPITDADKTLAAVKALESLLAYILAFSCADEAAMNADPKQAPSIKTWRSMHGFLAFVRRSCETAKLPLLMGIACQLGGVINSRILEIMVQHPSERPAKDIAVEIYGFLAKNVQDGESRLDVDDLQEHFPKSWKNRAKGILAEDKPNVPADFAGAFKLPIGTQVPPLRAARAGYALLEEWMGKEGVEYELKLKF